MIAEASWPGEIAAPAVAVLAASALVFLGLVVAAGIRDIATYTIPNWMSLAIAGAFGAAAIAAGLPLPVVGWHLLAAVIVFTVGAIMFHYGAMGGGDVKLMTASALWTGPTGGVMLVLLVSLYGGVLTLLVVARHRLKGRHRSEGAGAPAGAASPGVPYGAAIATNVLTVFIVFPGSSGRLLKLAAEMAAGLGG